MDTNANVLVQTIKNLESARDIKETTVNLLFYFQVEEALETFPELKEEVAQRVWNEQWVDHEYRKKFGAIIE